VPKHSYSLSSRSDSVICLRRLLFESLKVRILNVPEPPKEDREHKVRIAVLFSGGLDCTVLARMAHDLLPPEQEIDLINVAFENPRSINAAKKTAAIKKRPTEGENLAVTDNQTDSECISCYELCPDRKTGRSAFQELAYICPGRVWRFVAVRSPRCISYL
jgi:asparagine synthetase B (glutamine-hydrolysing)